RISPAPRRTPFPGPLPESETAAGSLSTVTPGLSRAGSIRCTPWTLCDELRDGECGRRREAADDRRLPCAFQRLLHREPSLDVAEDEEREKRQTHGAEEGGPHRRQQKVGQEGHHPSPDVGQPDGEGARP